MLKLDLPTAVVIFVIINMYSLLVVKRQIKCYRDLFQNYVKIYQQPI